MFLQNNSEDEENSVPSWLKEENDEKSASETAPLIANYSAGQRKLTPKSSSSLLVEEDYGTSSQQNAFPARDDSKFGEDNPTWLEEPEQQGKEKSISDDENNKIDDEKEDNDQCADSQETYANWNEYGQGNVDNRKPRRTCCHSIFVTIQVFAIVGNLMMLSTQIVPMIICDVELIQKVMRCYLAFFSFVFLLAEFEVSCLKSRFFQNWISRGFLYTFLGVVEIEQHYAMAADGSLNSLNTEKLPDVTLNVEWASFFINISSWWLIGIGCLYFFMGVFCMKAVRKRCREQYQKKWETYKKSLLPVSIEANAI